MVNPKRKYTAQQKFEIIKAGLLSGAGVSEVCRRHGISTTLYYNWQKQFLDGALEGLKPKKRTSGNGSVEHRQRERIKRLESVVTEITEENLMLKKTLGGSAA